MASSKQGKTLYEGTKALIAENLDKLAVAHVVTTFPVGTARDAMPDGTQGEQLLRAFRTAWDDHTSSMSKIRDILKYMVRSFGTTDSLRAYSNVFLRTVSIAPLKGCRKYGMLAYSYSSIASSDPLYNLYENMYSIPYCGNRD